MSFERGVVHRPTLQKDGLHAEPFQLLENEGLQHELPCQSIRTVGQQHFESSTLRQVAHAVQSRAIQSRPAVALIGELLDDVHPMLGRIVPQGLQLRTDRMFLFLPLAGNTGVNGGSHLHSSPGKKFVDSTETLWPTGSGRAKGDREIPRANSFPVFLSSSLPHPSTANHSSGPQS